MQSKTKLTSIHYLLSNKLDLSWKPIYVVTIEGTDPFIKIKLWTTLELRLRPTQHAIYIFIEQKSRISKRHGSYRSPPPPADVH